MKKKIISCLTAFILFLSVLEGIPLSAFAGEGQPVAKDALAYAVAAAPDAADWDKYIDTSVLERLLQQARACLEDETGLLTQQTVDEITGRLNEAVAALQKHTLSLSVSDKALTLPVGETDRVTLTLSPADAADKVSWSVSSKAVEIVSGDSTGCTFKAVSYTAVPVTLTAESNGKSSVCTLTLQNPFDGVRVSLSSYSIYRTMTAKATAVAYGKDAENPSTDKVTWEWSSSDPSVASVDIETGLIRGISTGSCTITAKGKCGDKTIEGTSETLYINDFTPVTLLEPTNKSTATEMTITEGEQVLYSVHVSDNATIKKLNWASTDEKVMKVSSPTLNGSTSSVSVTAVKAGTATLTYKTTDGTNLTGKVKVTVRPMIKTLKLTEPVIVLNPDGEKKVGVSFTPSDAGNQLLHWASTDSTVCGVDFNGNLTAKRTGVCNIIAETTDGSNIKVICCVRVADPSAQVKPSQTAVSLNSPLSVTLTATVTTVSGQTYKSSNEVNWKSSDTSIATVSDGVITAKKAGTATVTVSAKDNANIRSTVKVTVTTPVTGIKLDKTEVKLGAGSSTTVVPTVLPEYASNKAVTWTSSNKAAATVSSTGKITAKAPGKATVTCKTADGGFTAKCTVTVITPVTGIKLSATTLSVDAGKTRTLAVNVTPSDATDKSVTFKSSNKKVATVDANGVVKGVKAGAAVITVTSADGACRAQCAVTVKQPVTGITVDREKKCYVGQVCPLGAAVTPSDASNKKLLYTSSNTAVATVNENGYITAKKKGTTAVTVKSEDGGFTETCVITVTPKISVTAFAFEQTERAMKTGEKFTLKSLFSPTDASEKGVKYSSSNSSVATVSSEGKVTAKGPGECVITGSCVDGGFTSKCKITVTQPVKGISFKPVDYTLAVGKTVTLTPNFNPSNATNKAVKWKSDNTKVATVSSKGKVKALSTGFCNITCTTVDGGYTAVCNFVVFKELQSITLAKTKAELARGKQMQLTVKFTPADATNKTLLWSSSKSSVASVDAHGKVTAKGVGVAVITCTSSDGGFTAKCEVTVYRPADSVKINYTSLKLDAGKSKTLTATLYPSSVTYKVVTWKSTDTTVAKISDKGKLTAVAEGTARIIATSKDGYCTAYCAVTVVQPPEKVVITAKSSSLDIGCATQLKATVKPSNAYDKRVHWSSSDEKIAEVSDIGVVTAKKAGKVKITCTTVTGAKKAVFELQCKIPPESIALNRGSLTLPLNKSTTLKAVFTPSNTTIQTVKWSSSNPNVVKVSSKGKVVAVSIGSATITAKSKDGGKKATCFITVPRRATGIKLNKSSLTVELNKTATLKATVLPADATYDAVKWKSSDPAIATVSSTGVVTGKKTGKATVTVTSDDGGFRKSCAVTVIIPPEKVTLSKTSATVSVGSSLTLKASVKPTNATNKSIKWSSSNTAVASVSSDGKVITKKTGTVKITATSSKSSVKAVCTLKVIVPVTGVKLSKSSGALYIGEALTLGVTVQPSNATDRSVKWSSSDKSVAKVSSSGVITAVSKGEAVITCKTVSGSKTATFTLKVKKAVQSVTLNATEKTLDTGTSFTVKPSVLPEDATEKGVKYTSSNPSVATVSTKGKVTAVASGSAVITVKSADGFASAKCKVTVIQPVTQIRLDKTEYHTTQTLTFALQAEALPENAYDKAVTWSSTDESILTVDESGLVTAAGVGTAEIVCTDARGKVSARCTVTVGEAVAASVELNAASLELSVGEVFSLSATVYPLVCSQEVTFTSGNAGIAYVNEKGVVVAMESGSTVIVVESADGFAIATCTVTVGQQAASD